MPQDVYAKDFLEEQPGFLERASTAASSADCVAAKALAKAPPRVKKEKQPPKPKKKAKGISKDQCGSKVCTWWQQAGFSSSPLKSWYLGDKQKGLKMDAKNFASRAYHRVDDVAEREAAQEAHAEAKSFLATM